MKLSTLLEGTVHQNLLVRDVEITGITMDSRKITPGCLFCCINGRGRDGHDFAANALEDGAAAVVTQRYLSGLPQIIVADTVRTYGLLCARFYQESWSSLRLIGITGTNGKTTTSVLLKQILERNGFKTGLIGTIENVVGDHVYHTGLTTPPPEELHRLFAQMQSGGCRYAVAEISSQALDQGRLEGLHFACTAFTNLTRDHLDYHGGMENYYQAKKKLFSFCRVAVINIDDPWGERLAGEVPCRVVRLSRKALSADYRISQARTDWNGSAFRLDTPQGTFSIETALWGEYNIDNTACAVACAVEAGVPARDAAAAANGVQTAKGRLESVEIGGGAAIVIDYAHTPDALQKALAALRKSHPKRLICVFGCGGDRDATKRPLMGRIAVENSDFTIITSDNPRTENPEAIIHDILEGIPPDCKAYRVMENRKDAISFAISQSQKGDLILLAGKGHEDYQILGRQKIHFDEREIIQEILLQREKERKIPAGAGQKG